MTGCSYPSMTGDDDGLYVVWQRANGSLWDIVYSYSISGGGWPAAPYTLETGVSCPQGVGPTPVIVRGFPTFELMVVHRNAGGLMSFRTTRDTPVNPSDWGPITMSGTDSYSQDPSLVYDPNRPGGFQVAYSTGGEIRHAELDVNHSWGNVSVVNEGIAGQIYDNLYSTYSLSEYGDKDIAWEALDGWQRVIMHNRNLNPDVFSEFYAYYNHSYRPSVTGLDENRSSLVWQYANNLIKQVTNVGEGWKDEVSLG